MTGTRWIRAKDYGEPFNDRLRRIVRDPDLLEDLLVVLVNAAMDRGVLVDADLRGLVLEGVEYTKVVSKK